MLKRKLFTALLTTSLLYSTPSVFGFADVAHAEATPQRESKRVPAMRNRVYTQLALAQQTADAGDKAKGLLILDEVKERIEQLNSYEKAMLWNFYGFMYYGNDDVTNAIVSFEQVIAQEAIPDTLYLSTTYSLAQLASQQGDYVKSLKFLKAWQANSGEALQAPQHMLFAQVYYQDKKFNKSIQHIDQAIALAKAKNKLAKENWLTLQRAAYYELKQPVMVTKVMEELVRYYQKPEYWLQLSSMYGEIGEEKKQLATMETAWQAGYITKSTDIVMLAQLYLFNQLPYKAARLLDDAIGDGLVVAAERHMQLMAQAYVMAKEDDKAIPVLKKGSEIAENGLFDEQLAQTFINTEKWRFAITAAKKAIQRGGLTNEGNMHLALGMAHFNLDEFSEALDAFNQAKSFNNAKKTAKQWLSYVEKEKQYHERLVMINTH